jgi:CTP synthase (UTP-ammonia lyase)
MENKVAIGIIGDFDKTRASHVATNLALMNASSKLNTKLETDWLATSLFEAPGATKTLKKYDGVMASPGSPYKSMGGVLAGINTARESNIPFIGT